MRYIAGLLAEGTVVATDDDYQVLAAGVGEDGYKKILVARQMNEFGDGRFTEWITWELDEASNCHTGHYLAECDGHTLKDAREDFRKRLGW